MGLIPNFDDRIHAQDAEHKAVIDAAKTAGVRLLAYTSVLRADTSTLLVAPHHLATEQYLAASGIPWVFLRHPSYIENYTASLASALEYGSIAGSAGDGRNSAATRADLAEAAAVVLTTPGRAGNIYELGSDVAFTMAEFAAEVSKQSGKRVVYNNMPQQDYRALLESVGVPATFANLAADSDVKAASRGELYTGSRDLSSLIGHAARPNLDHDERVWQRADGSKAGSQRGRRSQDTEERITHDARVQTCEKPAEQIPLLLHRVIPGWKIR